jgi:predicted transcriptional regulator
MALVTSNKIDREIEQRLKELLEQRNDIQRQETMLAEIRESVKQYEVRYGMSSDCIHDAIDAGELVEDLDVCDWILQYNLLRRVEAK